MNPPVPHIAISVAHVYCCSLIARLSVAGAASAAAADLRTMMVQDSVLKLGPAWTAETMRKEYKTLLSMLVSVAVDVCLTSCLVRLQQARTTATPCRA